MQDRISDRANKLDFKRPAPLIHVIERIAKVLVQRPADAVVITNGRNNMGAYGANVTVEDRWAIIAYLRALQLARLGSIDDVPQELRAALNK